ncbi:MAG: hypothetical protein Q7R94_01865 [bacterium]|nr:hypothetical protein [bacterium]
MFSKIFKKHPDFFLIGFAILLLAVIGTIFFWGITTLIFNLNRAISIEGETTEGAAVFDIKGAASLDLKGLAR